MRRRKRRTNGMQQPQLDVTESANEVEFQGPRPPVSGCCLGVGDVHPLATSRKGRADASCSTWNFDRILRMHAVPRAQRQKQIPHTNRAPRKGRRIRPENSTVRLHSRPRCEHLSRFPPKSPWAVLRETASCRRELTSPISLDLPRPRETYGEKRDSSQPLRKSVGRLSPPGTGNKVHKVVVNSERDLVRQNQTTRRFPTAVPRNWIRSGALQGRRRNRIQRLQHPPDQMHAMADGVLDASLHAKPR